MNDMNISTAARQSGLPSKTIRYYEDIGLLPKARRSESGYRDYSDDDVALQRFVRRARELGFGIKESGKLIQLFLNPDRASRDVHELANRKITEIDQKIEEFKAAKAELKALTDACASDEGPDCAILENLSGGRSG